MAEKVLMLALSPTMDSGTIVSWLKKPGDTISSGDVICEVETDKATMDYESIQEGTLRAIVAGEGSSVQVGDTIAVIGSADEDISALLEEDKTREAPVPEEKPADSPVAPEKSPEKEAYRAPTGKTGNRIFASPLARRVARDRGIQLETVTGSGPGGRIVKKDIEQAGVSPAKTPSAAPGADENIEKREKVSGKRKIIAERLSESMRRSPHYYEKVRVAMDGLLEARDRLNTGRDRKLMLNSFLIRFAAEALGRHPHLRSSWQGDEIITYGRIDIGLAVALDDGLITPVVRDCGSKSILDIDTELAFLVEKARSGKLQPEEYSGAIFTISNLGAWGIEEFTAVINPPASAILAVGAARREPVVEKNGTIGVKTLSAMTLSADHRVIDGATAAAFLIDLKGIIEYPVNILK